MNSQRKASTLRSAFWQGFRNGLQGKGIPFGVGLFCFAVVIPVEGWAYGVPGPALAAGTIFGVFGYVTGRWTERNA